MSALTVALERILQNLNQKAPEIILRLQPGLTRKEIDKKAKDLPGRLPEEAYELYKWHNGFSEPMEIEVSGFNGVQANFCSLEESINHFQELKISGCPSNIFLIFSCNHEFGGDCFAVILGKISSPIVHFNAEMWEYLDEQLLLENQVYPSLTNMIYALGDYCQSNMNRVSYLNGHSIPFIDRNNFNKIHHKYSDKT